MVLCLLWLRRGNESVADMYHTGANYRGIFTLCTATAAEFESRNEEKTVTQELCILERGDIVRDREARCGINAFSTVSRSVHKPHVLYRSIYISNPSRTRRPFSPQYQYKTVTPAHKST